MKKIIFIAYIALLVFQETKGIYEHFKSSFYIGEYSSCLFFYLFLFKGKMLILILGAEVLIKTSAVLAIFRLCTYP